MCIVAIAWQLFDEVPLVLLSNRDEFCSVRPSRYINGRTNLSMLDVTLKVAARG